ncbi:small integral membrane protein 32-like [Trematomus bernacchii]|nr:small integral membrane protein 32-like [Trematomus bernacchii]
MRSRDCVFSSSPAELFAAQTKPVSTRGAMLRQILLNSTHTPDFDLVLMAQSSTHAPSSLNASHGGSVSVAALLRPTAGRGGLREGELHKPDLITYIVMCLLLFLLVLLIVFFINCQLRNSFFASMPYDRSLREARTSYK